MIKGSECLILSGEDAEKLLTGFYAILDYKGGYEKLREAGVLDLFDQLRTFVRDG